MVVEPGQQTRMTQSANGVPVIEIADPNSKGLSHNRFEQFNVSQPGVIFNNSMQDGTSQIGSHVIHNSNLTREAKAILTEVTGNSPSTLAGTLEVFGGKADILIAKGQSSAENTNQIGGNIGLTTTQGDIDLNGVNIQGGKVVLNSAGNINQRASRSSMGGETKTEVFRVGLTGAASTGPVGSGIGASVGADSSTDEGKSSVTRYTNGLISGTDVSIKAKGDHTMEGANIKADQLSYDIGGNQVITGIQDVSKTQHERSSWSAAIGVAMTTFGPMPIISAGGSYGFDFDNSNITAEQSGINAGVMNLHVGGDQALTGAHIINKSADGSYRVDGKTTAATLREFRDKDGGYIGGSAGTSKSGIPSFVMEAGRVDQVDYKATQNATVDLGAVEMNVGKGITGQLNRDASKQTEVSQNTKTAGTDIRFEISMPAPKNKPPVDDETPPARKPEAESAPPKPPVDAVDGGGGGNDTNARHMSEHTTGNDLKSALAKINSPIRADQADIQNNPVTVHVRNAAGEVETFKIRNNADLENLNGKIIVTGQQAEGLPVPKGYGKSSTLYIQLVKHSGGGYTYKLTPKKPTGIIDKSW